MNGNAPIPPVLWGTSVIAAGQKIAPTSDQGDQVLSVQLDRFWARPWRVSVLVQNPTQAFDKLGQPLQPTAVPSVQAYAQTRRARLLWRFSQQQEPITVDLPAQGAVFTVSASTFTLCVYDPGPDNGTTPKPTYLFALEEAPTAPTERPIWGLPKFTQVLATTLAGAGAPGVIWVTPRRAVALVVVTNDENSGTAAPLLGTYVVTFYDGQSDVVTRYVLTVAATGNNWDAAAFIPVPPAGVTYSVQNTAAAPSLWRLPRAVFFIDL